MKKLTLVVLMLGLTGCATPEEREATRRAQSYCIQQGRVVYERAFTWDCITQEQALALKREQERQERERKLEEAREAQRNHEKEVACIASGGTWMHYNHCWRAPSGPTDVRIVR
jgi:hypothetical protein